MSSSRSNKKLSKAEGGQIIDHSRYMKTYRHHVMRILREIREGRVNEEDLDKLQNFCQMSFSLMETAPMHQIQGAWRHAEILAFEHGQVEDADGRQEGPTTDETQVVLGPTEFKQVQRKSNSVSPFIAAVLKRSK